jgi:hypothetical protein
MSELQVKNLEWELEVQQQRLSQTQRERDDLYEKFESSVLDVQQKTGEWGLGSWWGEGWGVRAAGGGTGGRGRRCAAEHG